MFYIKYLVVYKERYLHGTAIVIYNIKLLICGCYHVMWFPHGLSGVNLYEHGPEPSVSKIVGTNTAGGYDGHLCTGWK